MPLLEVPELQQTVQEKMLLLIRHTRRIGNRAETVKKFKAYIKPYYSLEGFKQIKNWNFYAEVLNDNVQVVHSTNGAEGNNSRLNNQINACNNLNEILQAIKTYKSDQITRYHEEVEQGIYQKTRSTTIWRHRRLYDLIKQYSEYNIVQKVTTFNDVCFNVGWLMTFVKNKN